MHMTQTTARSTSNRFVTGLSVIALLASALPLLVPVPSTNAGAGWPLPPALRLLATTAPSATTEVLIRATANDGQPEAAVTRLGGHITRAIPHMHLLGATIPAGALPALATSPGVGRITQNLTMHATDASTPDCTCPSDYTASTGAAQVWAQGYDGTGVTVAVLDSGINGDISDFGGRVSHAGVNTPTGMTATSGNQDSYGHGTHVAGIIGGGGDGNNNQGMAPNAQLIDVHAAGSNGSSTELDVISGLWWIIANKSALGIRIVNISLSTDQPQSYLVDPLDAAVEMAWSAGLVVVVAAGNQGANSALYAPGNDPFVITVGAVNDNGQTSIAGIGPTSFSSYGVTQDGFTKPDLVAPGMHVVSTMGSDASIATTYPGSFTAPHYFQMSGTSMAALVVSGAAALLLQQHPSWNPNNVKFALTNSATPLPFSGTGAGFLNVVGALTSHTPGGQIKQTFPHSNGLDGALFTVATTTANGATTTSVSWNSISWNNVNWNNVNWNSISWNNVNWNNYSWSCADCSAASAGTDTFSTDSDFNN